MRHADQVDSHDDDAVNPGESVFRQITRIIKQLELNQTLIYRYLDDHLSAYVAELADARNSALDAQQRAEEALRSARASMQTRAPSRRYEVVGAMALLVMVTVVVVQMLFNVGLVWRIRTMATPPSGSVDAARAPRWRLVGERGDGDGRGSGGGDGEGGGRREGKEREGSDADVAAHAAIDDSLPAWRLGLRPWMVSGEWPCASHFRLRRRHRDAADKDESEVVGATMRAMPLAREPSPPPPVALHQYHRSASSDFLLLR